jgi:hypothetical protein
MTDLAAIREALAEAQKEQRWVDAEELHYRAIQLTELESQRAMPRPTIDPAKTSVSRAMASAALGRYAKESEALASNPVRQAAHDARVADDVAAFERVRDYAPPVPAVDPLAEDRTKARALYQDLKAHNPLAAAALATRAAHLIFDGPDAPGAAPAKAGGA